MHPDLPDDLGLLIALEALLAERHVTRASKRLGITQSAASQRLARLREFFEDPLLLPGRPRMVLTPRAQALAEPLSRALAALRAAVRVGAPFDGSTSTRHFVLLGNDVLEAYGVPRLFPMLAREAPRVTIQIDRVDADFAQRLERGTADLAFAPDGMVTHASLRRLPLPAEPFIVLVRAKHPLAAERLTLARYLAAEHLLIAPRGLPGSLVDAALERVGKRRRVALRIQHFSAAPFVLKTTDLVLTCPAFVAAMAQGVVPLRRLKLPLALPDDRSSIVWHERSHADAGHVWLRERIRAGIGTAAPERA